MGGGWEMADMSVCGYLFSFDKLGIQGAFIDNTIIMKH